uniref:phosphoserine phosphatase n=1 Tax=Octactis speculum TaxID=3111310 RepID=A0A7S2D0K5_9STRA
MFSMTWRRPILHANVPRALSRSLGSSASISLARESLRTAQAVCFDVDSTVITEEGIDVLAAHCGAGEAVAELTAKAMGGTMLFQDALAARLDLIRPSMNDITDCLADHPPQLTPGVHELIDALHERGTAVYLVSGGFRQMINPIAERLSIPLDRIYANNLIFNEDGSYQGFDPTELTSMDGGKPRVIERLKAEHGYEPVVAIGDGVTDMQASPPAEAFIGFGGVACREPVKNGADWFVTDFTELVQIVK